MSLIYLIWICSIVFAIEHRLFHVLSRGNTVEGAVFGMLHKVKHGFYKDFRKFDEILWTKGGCQLKTHVYNNGYCTWCSKVNPGKCAYNGTFKVSQFKDDHRGYSLKSRGNLELIKFRPETNYQFGKAEIDSFYLICEDFSTAIPYGEPGVITVDNLPKIAHNVNPRVRITKGRDQTAICTKAFYGAGINSRTIEQFVSHYLEDWKFDVIYVYELGTSIGILLKDVIKQSKSLTKYYLEKKLILIDLRNELQRMYGAIAGDMVLFSSKNGQLIVASDCINRAKSRNIKWILPIDWDEILTFPATRANPPPQSFLKYTEEIEAKLSAEAPKGFVRLVYLQLQRELAVENLICENCETNFDPILTAKLNLNTTQDDNLLKYALRIFNDRYPATWAYGVHTLSHCAYSSSGMLTHSHLISENDLYLRHYKCLNAKSKCDTYPRIPVNWGDQFGQ